MAPRLQDNWLKFLTCSDLKWHEYNVETGEYRNFFIHLDEEISKQEYFFNYIYCEMDKKNAIIPEIKIPLDYFIWKISKKRESNLYESKDKFLIGNKIYELIRIYGGESK